MEKGETRRPRRRGFLDLVSLWSSSSLAPRGLLFSAKFCQLAVLCLHPSLSRPANAQRTLLPSTSAWHPRPFSTRNLADAPHGPACPPAPSQTVCPSPDRSRTTPSTPLRANLERSHRGPPPLPPS